MLHVQISNLLLHRTCDIGRTSSNVWVKITTQYCGDILFTVVYIVAQFLL